MKRNRFSLGLGLLVPALLLTGACSSDHEEPTDTRQAVVLKGEIFTMGSDVATVWSGGQAVGVYMLKSGTQEVVDGYANKKHFADNRGVTGYLVPGDNNPMYLPTDGSKVDFRVYYPYDPEVNTLTRAEKRPHTTKVKITSTTKPDDFLYSDNDRGVGSDQTVSTVQIKSMLSVVNIEFNCPPDTKSLTAVIRSTATQALFDLMEGKFIERTIEVEKPITMSGSKESNNESTTFTVQATILSGEMEANAQVEVTTSNDQGESTTYEPAPLDEVLEVKEEQKVEENTQYNVSAQLNPSNPQIQTQLRGTSSIIILKWSEEQEEEGGMARPE